MIEIRSRGLASLTSADDSRQMPSPADHNLKAGETQQSSDAFPAPVSAASHALTARQSRLTTLTRVTCIGILVRTCIIIAELIGVWMSASASLFVDAIATLFDVLSSLILLAAIRFAARPPDRQHPFGHGRAELLAGFQLGIFLAITGGWMLVHNSMNLSRPSPQQSIGNWLWLISACATVVLGIVTWRIRQAGIASRSTALRAEASHFQVDMATSLITTLTLLAAAFWHDQSSVIDSLGAILLALLMIGLGIQAARENLNQLLDHVPEDEDFERVRMSALKVPGVKEIEKLLIQHAGPDAHVNIDVEVDPEISVAESHRISQKVWARIQSDWPFVRDVIVHVEPYYPGDHQ